MKRINVTKITSINSLTDKPINEVLFILKDMDQLDLIKNLEKENGNAVIKLSLKNNKGKMVFKLKDKRKVDRKLINSLKNKEISAHID